MTLREKCSNDSSTIDIGIYKIQFLGNLVSSRLEAATFVSGTENIYGGSIDNT
jgi:hypothetical protein